MKVGFPVELDEGMESKVYGHFGSAPAFVVVDTEKKEVGQSRIRISTTSTEHAIPSAPWMDNSSTPWLWGDWRRSPDEIKRPGD